MYGVPAPAHSLDRVEIPYTVPEGRRKAVLAALDSTGIHYLYCYAIILNPDNVAVSVLTSVILRRH